MFIYLQNNVRSSRSFQSPFAIRKRPILIRIVDTSKIIPTGLNMELALLRTIELIRIISTIVLSITDISSIDTLAIGAVISALRTCRNPAHEWQQLLTGGQFPILFSTAWFQDRSDAFTVQGIRLVFCPMAVVLGDLMA